MTIQVGDRLPDVPLAIAGAEGPKQTSSSEFFGGKRVALFAVPGAFTPTCSARHLPSYVEKAQDLRDAGIDEIACWRMQRRSRRCSRARSNDPRQRPECTKSCRS